MSAETFIIIIVGYFGILFVISWLTGRKATNDTFFLGNRKSPWFLVAFGMIGTLLSGATFISVPGWVGDSSFSYMQMVLGYLVGYFVIANVLLPLYYKLNLTSIYSYLGTRFGKYSYKTGSLFFILSRLLGASARLYLAAMVLQLAIFKEWGIPFEVTVVVTIVLIWLYTFRGGIKTVVWTDALQTLFMLLAVILTIIMISGELGFSFKSFLSTLYETDYTDTFFFSDWGDKRHFVKQFLSGIFIAIVMTGLDQDMMQKNLTCRNLKDARKNMFSYSIALIPVNLIFLSLGALLYIYVSKEGIVMPEKADDLFPMIATKGYLSPLVAIFFILGIIAASYSSADSTLTALTTSFSVDILNIEKYKDEKRRKATRMRVHVIFSMLAIITILAFNIAESESIVDVVFQIAGYTYGPLLGMFAFGLFTKIQIRDVWAPFIALASPVLSFVIHFAIERYTGYRMAYEVLIINGGLTFLGLLIVRR